MQKKYFGTDGIRGRANSNPMTADIAMRAGMATGALFRRGEHRHKVVIAKDTRLSGYMLESALTAGFLSVGIDVFLVGPLPTPAVAMLTRSMRADLGVMVSASHNLYEDNGIKFFDAEGEKLSDAMEQLITEKMDSDLSKYYAPPELIGRAKRIDDARGRYIEFAKATFPKHLRLDGLKIVIDCAHGAAYQIAPLILQELGAEIIALGDHPDGFNINKDCGSTFPFAMCDAVVAHKAQLGIALDGDADRVVMCDENGRLLDGDQILATIATAWKKNGLLKGGVVATHMSNLAFEHYLTTQKIKLWRSDIGDRYVVETMRQQKCNLGGEQSGHILMRDYTTTGDGLIAALQVLAVMLEENTPLSVCGRLFEPMPQILRNVAGQSAEKLKNQEVKQAIASATEHLGNRGRILVRKSGTEAKIRVMVEGEELGEIEGIADSLCGAISA